MLIRSSRSNQRKKLITAVLKVAKSSSIFIAIRDTIIPFTKPPKQYVRMAFQGV